MFHSTHHVKIFFLNDLHPMAMFMECGRAITGPYGYLVSRVLHKKEIYKTHIGLDANMANLIRPGMYGAYHHITVAGKEDWKHSRPDTITFSNGIIWKQINQTGKNSGILLINGKNVTFNGKTMKYGQYLKTRT